MEDLKNIKYTCIVDTAYALSVYLLYQSMEQIDETLFFIGPAVSNDLCKKLKHIVKIPPIKFSTINTILYKKSVYKYRSIIRKTTIYAQDHIKIAPTLISDLEYILLEDAPNIFTNYKSISFMNPGPSYGKAYLNKKVIFGNLYRKSLGRNKQCKKILYTMENDTSSELLIGKNKELISLNTLWENSSENKKELFYNMFNIVPESLSEIKKAGVVVFSQPLMEDCDINEEEMKNIYAPYIMKYQDMGVIIKPHPRDKFNYEKHFEGVRIFKTPAPMQILSAMGLEFKIAITVCSSAVSSMSDDCEVIWIGADVHPKVHSVYGDLKSPR